MYLNGVIQTGATGATLNDTVATKIGSNPAGASLYSGTMDVAQVYRPTCLTAQEAADFYTHSTYNYRNKAIGDWPMRDAQDDPGVKTLDVSGNNNHLLYYAGVTKRTKRGYDGDGSVTGYMETTSDIRERDGISFCVPFAGDIGAGARYILYHEVDIGGFRLGIRVSATGEFQIVHNAGGLVSSTGVFLRPGLNIISLDIDSLLKGILYINGENVFEVSVILAGNGGKLQIFRDSLPIVGSVFSTLVTDSLTPLQVADLHGKMMRSINRI
jgi:hypothetical protein